MILLHIIVLRISAAMSSLAPVERVRLPSTVRTRIAHLPDTDDFGADVESLTRAHDDLQALLIVIEAARLSATMPPPLLGWKSLGSSSFWFVSRIVRTRFLASFTQRMRAVDPHGDAEPDGDLRCLARFHHGEVPVFASASLEWFQ